MKSFRSRLILLVLLAILPAFGLVIVNSSEQRKVAEIRVKEDVLRIAQTTAGSYYDVVEKARELLFVLAQFPVLHENDREACNSFLSNLTVYKQNFTNILKLDLNGFVECDALVSHYSGNTPEDEILQRVIATRSFTVGTYVISPTTKQPAIGFGYPLLDERKRVQGVLIASFRLDSFSELFDYESMPSQSTLTLWDRNGIILSHFPNSDHFVGKHISDTRLLFLKSNLQQEEIIEVTGNDGINRLHILIPLNNIEHSDVFLSVGIPSDVAFAEVERALRRSLITLGFVATLAFGFAWIFSDLLFLRQINMILETTKRIASGDLTARTGLVHGEGELGQLAKSFDQMCDTLDQNKKKMSAVNEALKREQVQRARLLHKVITANEDERMRIARELHDETSQSLTALMIGLDTARLAVRSDVNLVTQQLVKSKAIADKMLKDIHRIVSNLRPSLLDDLGLVPAISWCGEKLLNPVGIKLDLDAEGLEERLPSMIETVIFRVVQEALTNIVRHSRASIVEIDLSFRDGFLTLRIADNGQGFNPSSLASGQRENGFGLQSIHERIEFLGGELQIQTSPGEGMTIFIRVLVLEQKADDD